ncbi:hypothetical protein H2198_008828 [Neophaeococcomyces mojaviensis]|uniref:Uncharacterized protein n=1 Tax=Neophaeococcomyces mojaviensis TaxID=3383035 RepID=A0ACC2ZW32_9EURO|nr:hypothetical protein H2198_008828 [Knufia sp. JES_112]
MSEPIPEAVPTSADPHSRRPVKRLRGANTAIATQANEIENLMWDPERPVEIPALSSETKSKLAPPPEIVTNVQGSSAGAGSGEFHVYKASRRREYERLRAMDEEAAKEEHDEKWSKELEEKRRRDEEKTRKNREKRNKRKGKGKGTKEGTPVEDDSPDAVKKNGNIKKPLNIPKREATAGENEENEGASANNVPENGITIHDED